MKTQTDIIFIIDRSGSMNGLEQDTIGGFNSFLKKQKRLKDQARISTILFDHEIQVLHNNMDISKVKYLTNKDYQVRGMTALYDAIGITITSYLNMSKNQKLFAGNKVEVVIITDGYENASTRYSGNQIRSMIEEMKSQDWQFIFLGANIDAKDVGNHLGIDRDKTVNVKFEDAGLDVMFEAVSNITEDCRKNKLYNPKNMAPIIKHYQK